MKTIYIESDGSGRIAAWSDGPMGGFAPVEVEDGFDPSLLGDYEMDGGSLSFTGALGEAARSAAASREADRQIRAAAALFVRTAAADMGDGQARQFAMLFEEWVVGGTYETGGILRYGGELYRVLQDVPTAQAEHAPDKAASLYKRIGEPSGGVFPWSQPLGATDAYAKGDRVTHDGKMWVSTVDANVWEPGVYGWDEVAG